MDRWERRAAKLDAKRRRMHLQGRGLLTTEPLAMIRRLKKAASHPAPGSKRKR